MHIEREPHICVKSGLIAATPHLVLQMLLNPRNEDVWYSNSAVVQTELVRGTPAQNYLNTEIVEAISGNTHDLVTKASLVIGGKVVNLPVLIKNRITYEFIPTSSGWEGTLTALEAGNQVRYTVKYIIEGDGTKSTVEMKTWFAPPVSWFSWIAVRVFKPVLQASFDSLKVEAEAISRNLVAIA